MIKNIYGCTKEEQFMMSMSGIYTAMSTAYRDKEAYAIYLNKNSESDGILGLKLYCIENKLLDLKILELLEKNGFSLDELGTFLYKDVIKKVLLTLQVSKNEQEELRQQLKNAYSQIYFDIARNDNDMGLKTFHNYIQVALAKINDEEASSTLIADLSREKPLNYGELAFEISKWFLDNKILKEPNPEVVNYKPNVRKLIKW